MRRTARQSRIGRDDAGASAVEFALVVPIVLLLVFGIINFGFVFSQQSTLNNAVREGARRAVVNDPFNGTSTTANPRKCDGIIASIKNQLSGLGLNAANVQVKVTQDGWTNASACGSIVPALELRRGQGQRAVRRQLRHGDEHGPRARRRGEVPVVDPAGVPAVPHHPHPHLQGGVPVRVQLLTAGRSSDDGVVAILVALLASVLFVLAAFAVDIGNAYAVARQQSVAADAAVLAAAAKVGEALPVGQPCTQALLDSVGANAIAKTTADLYNTANSRTGATEPVVSATVTCPTFDALEVRVDNSHPVKTTLAGVIGISQITPTSYAVARYQRTLGAGGLRPWAICDSTVLQAQANPGTTYATGIDTQAGPCNSVASGNWGGVDFDGGSNGATDLATWTMNGYPKPVTIPDPLLPADPGVSNSSGLGAAFAALVGKVVLFPSVTHYTGGNGGNASFDAVGLATVRICGVVYGNTTYSVDSATGAQSDCWVNPVGTTSTSVTTQTTTGTMANNGTDLTLTGPSGVTFPTVANPNVSIAVSVVGAGNNPGTQPLATTVATLDTATHVVLAARARKAVTNADVTITTTTTTYDGLVPLKANGNPIDHIQFRWVSYATSSYDGTSSAPCAFTDRRCVGFTELWR